MDASTIPVSLYLIATPIGNLGDISYRAVQTLQKVDFIAAEDTRKTIKLLNHLNIKKPLISYHEHNRFECGERIISRLTKGEVCGLVTDAGMPVISDPGEDIVIRCHEAGLKVSVIPGPCALVAALAVSGLSAGRFSFEGFLSVNRKNRLSHLEEAAKNPYTLIFYEAPHKLKRTLSDLYEAFGERKIVLVREISKIHEEILSSTLKEASELFLKEDPRGEFVLVVEGKKNTQDHEKESMEKAAFLMDEYLSQGLSKSQAVRLAAEKTGARKNELYRLLIKDES